MRPMRRCQTRKLQSSDDGSFASPERTSWLQTLACIVPRIPEDDDGEADSVSVSSVPQQHRTKQSVTPEVHQRGNGRTLEEPGSALKFTGQKRSKSLRKGEEKGDRRRTPSQGKAKTTIDSVDARPLADRLHISPLDMIDDDGSSVSIQPPPTILRVNNTEYLSPTSREMWGLLTRSDRGWERDLDSSVSDEEWIGSKQSSNAITDLRVILDADYDGDCAEKLKQLIERFEDVLEQTEEKAPRQDHRRRTDSPDTSLLQPRCAPEKPQDLDRSMSTTTTTAGESTAGSEQSFTVGRRQVDDGDIHPLMPDRPFTSQRFFI